MVRSNRCFKQTLSDGELVIPYDPERCQILNSVCIYTSAPVEILKTTTIYSYMGSILVDSYKLWDICNISKSNDKRYDHCFNIPSYLIDMKICSSPKFSRSHRIIFKNDEHSFNEFDTVIILDVSSNDNNNYPEIQRSKVHRCQTFTNMDESIELTDIVGRMDDIEAIVYDTDNNIIYPDMQLIDSCHSIIYCNSPGEQFKHSLGNMWLNGLWYITIGSDKEKISKVVVKTKQYIKVIHGDKIYKLLVGRPSEKGLYTVEYL